MAIRKIVVAGGRDFKDYELLKSKCDYYLSSAISSGDEIVIISGTANGADKLGERYAQEKGYKVERYPAKWNELGKKAGYVRNEEMAKVGHALIAFWNGSKGTKHMIDLAEKYKLHIRVVKY